MDQQRIISVSKPSIQPTALPTLEQIAADILAHASREYGEDVTRLQRIEELIAKVLEQVGRGALRKAMQRLADGLPRDVHAKDGTNFRQGKGGTISYLTTLGPIEVYRSRYVSDRAHGRVSIVPFELMNDIQELKTSALRARLPKEYAQIHEYLLRATQALHEPWQRR
jgi:hypothetical protein